MIIFDELANPEMWRRFYEHKTQKAEVLQERYVGLLDFIKAQKYLAYADALKNGVRFSAPKKMLVNKSGVGRKRTVYTYTEEENYLLGMIAFLLKRYDHIFAPNLYSFRVHKTAKMAFSRLRYGMCTPGKYVCRLDLSSYFNSIDPRKLLVQLKNVLTDDLPLYDFLEALLLDDTVVFEGEVIQEKKGAIPGAAVSSFFANLYLSDMDHFFYDAGVEYIRYSDDILVMADSAQELEGHRSVIYDFLEERGLAVNPEKEKIYPPNSKLEFLGFSYHNGQVDICEVSLKKIKAKIRRKTRALKRWADKKDLPGEYAAKALIKRFNQKFYCNPVYNELTWARWYFPVINTAKSLEIIDRYEVECIRYLLSGTHTKGKYAFTYEKVKELGFRSLVNEYYKFKAAADTT